MPDATLPRRTAAGFILARRIAAGDIRYLLLVNARRQEPGFPKGHAEPLESAEETARRETVEETGLESLVILPRFRRELCYLAERRGVLTEKTVVYFLAETKAKDVRLSSEHSAYRWVSLSEGATELPHPTLRSVLRDAALFLKDPALLEGNAGAEEAARAHLLSLRPSVGLRDHLEGAARLARRFASALREAGAPVLPEAAAAGALLHDVGRALGAHEDHQRAGLLHLRTTPLAAYGFACISHFTKGAQAPELERAGLAPDLVADFERLIDLRRLTWEEQSAALADSCMKGAQAVEPSERFRDLRERYGARPLIDLQEAKTVQIRAEMAQALGRDPLALLASA